MLTVFSKRTLSVILSLCLLILCAGMASATETETTQTDYAALVDGATLRADAADDNITESPESATDGFRTNDTKASSQIAGAISGFTSKTTSVEGDVKVTKVLETEESTNYVLKMTGQKNIEDDPETEAEDEAREVYSAFDTRKPESKTFHPTEGGTNYLQMWEIKVKLPETETGELRLFIYGNYNWYAAPRYQNSTQVMVKDGNVYRINNAYDTTETGIAYDDVIAEGLKAGEWYTFVRVMDMRDVTLHKDKIFVFDKDGAQVSEDTNWRNAGKFESYSSRARLSLGFAGKNFDAGEDVYFDDLRIWYIDEPTMGATLDGSASAAGKMMALDYDSTVVASDDYTWVSDPYQNTLRNGQHQDYSIDVFLPDVEDNNRLKLFSATMKKDWSAVAYNNYAFIIKGGTVYTNYHNYGGTNDTNTSYGYDNIAHINESVMTKDDGSNLVLSPKTWYTFSYKYDITTAEYTATVKERSSGNVLATKNGYARYKTTVSSGQNGRVNIIGVKGFGDAVLFDNAVCIAKDAEGTVKNSKVNYNFDDLAIGTAVSEVTKTTSNPTNVGVPCYAVSEGDFFLTGEAVASPEDILPMKISGIKGSGFTAGNVKVYVDDEEIKDGCTISTEDGSYTVSFNDLEYGVTYTLKLVNQISDDKWELPIDGEFTFTIAEDKLVIEQPAINGSLGESSITATVNITNGRKTSVDYVVVLALYKGDALDKIAVKDGTLTSQPDVEVPITTDPIDATNATSAQIMIWDGWSSLRPLHVGLALPAAE